jgi:protoporphyrinogen oxidase
MAKELSAKDKAFQKERQRLMKQAESYRQLVITRDGQLYEKDKKIEELESIINTLTKEIESHFNMSAEEFAAHVSREKKANQAFEMLFSLSGTY